MSVSEQGGVGKPAITAQSEDGFALLRGHLVQPTNASKAAHPQTSEDGDGKFNLHCTDSGDRTIIAPVTLTLIRLDIALELL